MNTGARRRFGASSMGTMCFASLLVLIQSEAGGGKRSRDEGGIEKTPRRERRGREGSRS